MNISITTILALRLLCGFYYNLDFSRRMATVAKLYCLAFYSFILSIGILLLTHHPGPIYAFIGPTIVLTEYTIGVLFSFKIDKQLHQFFESLKIIYSSTSDPSVMQVRVTGKYLVIIVLVKTSCVLILCSIFRFHPRNYFSGVVLAISISGSIILSLVFELVWLSMAMVRKTFDQLPMAFYGPGGKEATKILVKKSLLTYKRLLDAVKQFYLLKLLVRK